MGNQEVLLVHSGTQMKYKRSGRLLAVASIFRDLTSLQAEVNMERKAMFRVEPHASR